MNDEAHHRATARQAGLLLRPEWRALLGALMNDALSASQVARHLGTPLARASYLLGTLLRAEIATVERSEARAGRAVKYYRVAPRWFIPYEVTDADTLEAFCLAQIGPRMERISALAAAQLRSHSPAWGLWLSQGDPYSNMEIGDERGPARDLFGGDEPLMLTSSGLRLSEPQARRLKRLLLELMERARESDLPDAPEYTLSLMLVRGAAE